MQRGAEDFASMASELAKAMERRKWWQLWYVISIVMMTEFVLYYFLALNFQQSFTLHIISMNCDFMQCNLCNLADSALDCSPIIPVLAFMYRYKPKEALIRLKRTMYNNQLDFLYKSRLCLQCFDGCRSGSDYAWLKVYVGVLLFFVPM
mgnify:CR=1 FL=1